MIIAPKKWSLALKQNSQGDTNLQQLQIILQANLLSLFTSKGEVINCIVNYPKYLARKARNEMLVCWRPGMGLAFHLQDVTNLSTWATGQRLEWFPKESANGLWLVSNIQWYHLAVRVPMRNLLTPACTKFLAGKIIYKSRIIIWWII